MIEECGADRVNTCKSESALSTALQGLKIGMHDRELRQFIEHWQSTGTTDSSGVFTISTERAQEKLSQFALPHPRLYVLNLVASAVSGGARGIELTFRPGHTVMRYDGKALSLQELSGLWNLLLHPEQPTGHELAVGLNAARALSPVELYVESRGADGGYRLDVEGDLLRVVPLPPDELAPSLPHCVGVKESSWRRPWLWVVGIPERVFVRKKASWAPLQLTVDGARLPNSVEVGDSPKCAAWLRLGSGEVRLNAVRPEPSWAPYCVNFEPKLAETFQDGVLALSLPQEAKAEGLTLVVNGIVFTRPQELLGCPLASGVVVANALRKNLSHDDLTEDETYRELVEALQRRTDELVVNRLESPLPLPPELVQPLLAWAPQLNERLRAQGLTSLRAVLRRWRKEARFLGDLLSLPLWTAILAEWRGLAGTPAGRALQQRLIQSLGEGGRDYLQAGQPHKAVHCWERLEELAEETAAPWRERVRDELQILRALCGMSVEPEQACWPEVRAALWRAQGEFERALSRPAEPLAQAEMELAMGEFESAEERLRALLAEGRESCQAAEALADLLAFARPQREATLAEAFFWKERAHLRRLRECPSGELFLLQELAETARSWAPFARWLQYRVKVAGSNGHPSLEQLSTALTEAKTRLSQNALGALGIKAALLSSETLFGPDHPMVKAARVRACRYLRQAGEWKEADQLLARGQLLSLLGRAWAGDGLPHR